MGATSANRDFKKTSSQDNSLRRGAVVLLRMPNGNTPDVPGERLKRALVWNVNKDEANKVTDLDVMWISNSAPVERLQRIKKDSHVLTQSQRVHEYMGYDKPVLIDTAQIINVPVNYDFFPKGRVKGNVRIVHNSASGVPVRIIGSAGGKFLDVIEGVARRNARNDNKLISKGSVVMVNLPNGSTPDVPGRYTRPALVWDTHFNKDNKLVGLQLMWMRSFSESSQIMNIMKEHHVMATDKELCQKMGSSRSLLIDPSHSILVPVKSEFFPKSVNNNRAKIYNNTSDGTKIGVVGCAPMGFMMGVIAPIHKGCVDSRFARQVQIAQEKEQRDLDKIQKEFGLNKLGL